MYVPVRCFVVRGCAISRRYIDVYNCDMYSVVNEVCSLMVEDLSVVVNSMFSLMSVMNPPHALYKLSVRTVVKLCTLGVFALGVSLVS